MQLFSAIIQVFKNKIIEDSNRADIDKWSKIVGNVSKDSSYMAKASVMVSNCVHNNL